MKKRPTFLKRSDFSGKIVRYDKNGFSQVHFDWFFGVKAISIRWKRVTTAMNIKPCKVQNEHCAFSAHTSQWENYAHLIANLYLNASLKGKK